MLKEIKRADVPPVGGKEPSPIRRFAAEVVEELLPNARAGQVFEVSGWPDDGTVALQGLSISNDGKYTAYIISRSGSDWNEIFVMDTESKKLLDDHIESVSYTHLTLPTTY